jgi:hypothetical protein
MAIEFVPIALGCGHVVTDEWPMITWDLEDTGEAFGPAPGSSSRIECPSGCGLQTWVKDPEAA